MQPPPLPPQPAQPALAPAAPTPGTPTVVLPNGPVPLQGLPNSVEEIQGLRERREILRDQLVRATNRRGELAAQLNRGLAEDARAGVQQRLNLLDARILQIESDQALTERLLSSARPDLLAQTAQTPDRGPVVDEDDAVAGAFAAFGGGVLLTLIIGRIRRRMARRRAGVRTGSPAALPEDPRFDRLAQAVDAMAEEVERIGEGQRFVTQLLAERRNAGVAIEAERR